MVRYALPSSLDTAAAPALAAALGEQLARGQSVTVEGAAVARVGQACLQVLVAALASATARDIGFVIADPSDELVGGARIAGIDTLFWPAAPAAGAR